MIATEKITPMSLDFHEDYSLVLYTKILDSLVAEIQLKKEDIKVLFFSHNADNVT